jgi:hypothetical protein
MIELISSKNAADWDCTKSLKVELAAVPENGTFRWANGHRNKLQQLEFIVEAGLRIPYYTTNLRTAIKWLGEGIVLGRRYEHCDGNDIRIGMPGHIPQEAWMNKDFWVKYVPIKYEWRIHIFDGLRIARARKCKGRNELLPGLGATFEARWEPPKGITEFAKGMVKACRYLYGACDIIETPEGDFVALEVNTASELGTVTLPAYTRACQRLFAAHPGESLGGWPYDGQ